MPALQRRFICRGGDALRRGLAAIALGWCASAGAQTALPASCPPEAQPLSIEQIQAGLGEGRDRGLLWRLRRDGRVSYLYGTVHVARASWVFPGPTLVRALAASDTVALELDMLDPDIQRRVATGMRAGPDEQLPAALAARLQAQWRAACVPPEAMATVSPALQLATLTALAARADGLDPAYAIDLFLALYGRVLGKTVHSLETPELQLALLKGDGPQAAQEGIAHGLDQLERGEARPVLLRAATAWADGREHELARYEAWCRCADTAAERAQLARLLDDRNPALADGVEALHATGQRVFAAVGALHMVGPMGLPALLAARGFVVERIVPAP